MTEPSEIKTDKNKVDKASSANKKRSVQGNSFVGLLLSPGFWPVALYELCVAWFFTRKWLRLLTMLPFVAGIGFLLFASFRGSRMNSAEIVSRYLAWTEDAEKGKKEEKSEGTNSKEVVEEAKKTPDIQSLDIYYRRLLSTTLPETMRFKIASFLAANGKIEQARSQIQMLAPEDRAGFGPAHLWMVQSMMASRMRRR